MVTYKTLEVYLEKCQNALETIKGEVAAAEKNLRFLQDSRVALLAQIKTLEELMDVENNPPASEIPVAGEDLERLFSERLGRPQDPDGDTMRGMRQEGVYKREAMASVEALNEINEEAGAGESSSVDPS